MVISWFGLSSFKISSGNFTLVTDHFGKAVGLTPPRVQTDIAVISNNQNEYYNNQGSLAGEKIFVVDGPGEFDARGVFVRGIAAMGDPKNKVGGFDHTTIYGIAMEDILMVPVGGKTVCDAEEAAAIINQIEPQIVVPMHYAQPGLKLPLDKVEQFLKETGSGKIIAQDKLTLKKSNLQELGETMQVVLLNPQR